MQNDPKQFSMEEAIRLAGTPAGRQLLNLLKSSANVDMHQARKAMESGDLEQAKKSLAGLMQSPDVLKLLKEMGYSNE